MISTLAVLLALASPAPAGSAATLEDVAAPTPTSDTDLLVARGTRVARSVSAGGHIGKGRNVGFGMGFGQPSGVTGKFFVSPALAIGALFGYWWSPYRGPVGAADVLYHLRELAPAIKPFELSLFFGGGAGFGWATHRVTGWYQYHDYYYDRIDDPIFYMRAVVGASFFFRRFPLETYLEVAPVLRFLPHNPDVDGSATLGARFYF